MVVDLVGDEERASVAAAGGVAAVIQAMKHFPDDLKIQASSSFQEGPFPDRSSASCLLCYTAFDGFARTLILENDLR